MSSTSRDIVDNIATYSVYPALPSVVHTMGLHHTCLLSRFSRESPGNRPAKVGGVCASFTQKWAFPDLLGAGEGRSKISRILWEKGRQVWSSCCKALFRRAQCGRFLASILRPSHPDPPCFNRDERVRILGSEPRSSRLKVDAKNVISAPEVDAKNIII